MTTTDDDTPETDSVLDPSQLDDAEDLTMGRLMVIDDMWDDDSLTMNPGGELSEEVDEEMQP